MSLFAQRFPFLPEFPVFLAPLAGVSDLPFRSLCHEQGCDMSFTEMVSAKGLSYENGNTKRLLALSAAASPCGVQLFGSDPALMADMAKRLYERHGENIACIDVNMGCPVHKIVKNGEGSALMRDFALAGKIAAAIAKATPLPLSVKFRKGFYEDENTAAAFARVLADNGAAMLTLHGRTRAQMYSGAADYACIGETKAALLAAGHRIPLVGNGDIDTGEDALRMREETGCDGVMLARGAMGNPFLFAQVKAALAGAPYRAPTLRMRMEAAMEHSRRLEAERGAQGVIEMRKHAACYVKGLRGAAKLRTKINACTTGEAMRELFASLAAEE